MDWERIGETVGTQVATFGLKVVGAIALWLVGRWLIALATKHASAALERERVDPTLRRYIATSSASRSTSC